MQLFQIGENQAGQRLDKFLHKFMPAAGNGFLYKMLRKKNIVLNGKKAEGKEILAVGDTVSFFFSDETFCHFTGQVVGTEARHAASESASQRHTKEGSACKQDRTALYKEAYGALRGITIIYEDKNILAVNKPAGVLTQRDSSGEPSLNEWVIGYLLHSGRLSEDTLKTFHPSVQNRLDRNTSGIVLCGVSLSGSQMLSELIRSRKLNKYYITIVKGSIDEAGELSGFLSKDEQKNQVRINGEEGREVKTAYRPLAVGEDVTCLEVKLITGRPHQIRAHMASIGHPVMGDMKYGDAAFNADCRKKYGVRCQLLHAAKVEFPMLSEDFSDLSGKVFTAPLPAVMKEVCRHGNMEFQRTARFYAGGIDKQNQ
ncbi:MAG: RluA family pseudouridine synthase [Lachnospiraceae bacterium]|nr:RluA family pseudouridine synthase [Lachnospiraceae bacterium]